VNFIARLLGAFRPLQITDEYFGSLLYMKMPKGRVSYWEGRKVFRPLGVEVELFVDAPEPQAPPSQLQRDFFAQVEASFSELVASAATIVQPRFEEWTHRPMSRPFEQEFTLTSFSIPAAALKNAEWDASFESKTDTNHLFSVSFKGTHARDLTIDG
jgi:hypothetical protein